MVLSCRHFLPRIIHFKFIVSFGHKESNWQSPFSFLSDLEFLKVHKRHAPSHTPTSKKIIDNKGGGDLFQFNLLICTFWIHSTCGKYKATNFSSVNRHSCPYRCCYTRQVSFSLCYVKDFVLYCMVTCNATLTRVLRA